MVMVKRHSARSAFLSALGPILHQDRSQLTGPVDPAIFSQLHSPAGHQLESSRKDLVFCYFDSFRQCCNSVTPLHRNSFLQDDLSSIYIFLKRKQTFLTLLLASVDGTQTPGAKVW